MPPSIDTRTTGVISKGARSVSELGGGSHNPGIRPFTYHYTPLPPSQIKLGNNIWENYQLVGQEVQKKNQKLTELNNIIRQMRISNDQNQIRNLNIQLANARQELARAISENQQIERQIEQANQKNKALKSEESASEAELQRIILLAKSPQELNSQLQQLKNEHDKIRASVAKMDYDAKIQLDKESRESMEKKLLEICLESAKKNNDPRVKDLLAKIQAYQKA